MYVCTSVIFLGDIIRCLHGIVGQKNFAGDNGGLINLITVSFRKSPPSVAVIQRWFNYAVPSDR